MPPGQRSCLVRDCPSTLVQGGGLCAYHRDQWERHRHHMEEVEGELHPWQIVMRFERWCWRAHRELKRDLH